ncbi:MAG TPA: DoxX family protein [Lysobacter sp.]|nr:DoxX family protein [Lysobacter sp.]
MNTANSDVISGDAIRPAARPGRRHLPDTIIAILNRIPHSAIALLGRFAIAMTFWVSGQTKIEGLVLDPIGRTVEFGMPRLSDSAVELFRSEYALPIIPPELAAYLAATVEHLLPLLLLLGLATRVSALGLLVMTLVIQIFVYPLAFPTHAMWATVLLYLIARGPGAISLDHLFTRRRGR